MYNLEIRSYLYSCHQEDELKFYTISLFIILRKLFYFVVLLLLLGKDAIYTIPVKNILAVEKLEDSSFNKKNVSYK